MWIRSVRTLDQESLPDGKKFTIDTIHCGKQYPLEKQKHAFASLCALLGTNDLSREQWNAALDRAVTIQEFIRDQVYISRKKDYDNTFRQNTYRNTAEMTAAIGTIEDNAFIKQVRSETEEFKKLP